MKWINEYIKGSYGLYAGQVLSGFQPLDFYTFLPMWYDLFIDHIAFVIRKNNLDQKKFEEIKEFMPTPSAFRAILIKIIACYEAFPNKNNKDIKFVCDFFARILLESCPEDPFAISSNPFLSTKDIDYVLKTVPFREVGIETARLIGRLNTSAGSLVHGIYNDLVTDLGWDVYGPSLVLKENQEYTMLVRHFPNLSPEELWDSIYLSKYKEIKIYNLYQGVEWKISAIGCHTISTSGSPVEGMRYVAVCVDGEFVDDEEIKVIVKELSDKAETIYKKIRLMNFEELKEKVVLQEHFQIKSICDKYGIDWLPSKEIVLRYKDKSFPNHHLPHDRIMTSIEEYKKIFKIDEFENKVLNTQKHE